MDINETLRRMRALVEWEQTRSAGASLMDIADKFQELVELNSAMDEWLSRGGFLPDEWMASAFGPRVTD